MSSLRLLSTVIARARAMVMIALAAGVVVAIERLVVGREYEATASIVQTNRRSSTALAGLAAQLGLGTLQSEGAFSPVFYSDLVTSERVLLGAVRRLRVTEDSSYADLARELGVHAKQGEQREQMVRKVLRADLKATANTRTGLVQLTLSLPSQADALALLSSILDEIEKFDVETRQLAAGAERRFSEARLAEIGLRVAASEQHYLKFLETNRDVRNSPEMLLERDRLSRDLTFQQQLYNSLAQTVEQVRLEEAKDTPLILRVDEPWVGARTKSSLALLWSAGTMLIVLLLEIVLLWYRDLWRNLVGAASEGERRDLDRAFEKLVVRRVRNRPDRDD